LLRSIPVRVTALSVLYPSSPVHESNYGIPRVETAFIVLHGTGLSMAATAEDELKSFSNPSTPGMGKSYSYYVAKDGRVWSLAPPDRVAYHAGASSWNKEAAARRKVVWPAEEGDAQFAALNLTSVGIGMESHNNEAEVYPEAQLHACATLCRDLMQRYLIPRHRVLTHYMVSAPRKVDPVGQFSLEQFYKRLETLRPPLLVIDAPEPVVHEGDYGSDILLRIRGKELKVDARFDNGTAATIQQLRGDLDNVLQKKQQAELGKPVTALPLTREKVDAMLAHLVIPNDLKPGDVVPAPSGLNRAERVEFSRLLNEKVNEVLTPSSAVKHKEVEIPMPIPAREAIAISAKAQRATEPDPEYKVSDKEAVTKYVTVIGNIVGVVLSLLSVFGVITLTELQAEETAAAIGAAISAIWPIVISITASIARSKVYSEATVGQLLADQKELLHREPVR
jgi:hypothetical protein